MASTVVLTQKMVSAALVQRGEGPVVLRDSKVPGLSLRVGKRVASYSLSYKPAGRKVNGQQLNGRLLQIGTVETHSLAEARRAAVLAKVQVSAGEDPSAERRSRKAAEVTRREKSRTVRELSEYYIRSRLSGSTKHVATETSSLRLAIREMNAAALAPEKVTFKDVRDMLDGHFGKACAIHRLGSLSRFFDDLVASEVVAENPCARLRKSRRPKPVAPRTRVYSAGEVQAIARAAQLLSPVRRRFLLALLRLPLRFGELAELRVRDVDVPNGRLVLPGKMTKNGDPFSIPVPEAARPLLFTGQDAVLEERVFQLARDGKAFASPQSFAKKIRKLSGVADFNFHHFRRTFMTLIAEFGIGNATVADALLNHRQTETRSGVKAAYNHAKLWAPKVEVMDAWEGLIESAIAMGAWRMADVYQAQISGHDG